MVGTLGSSSTQTPLDTQKSSTATPLGEQTSAGYILDAETYPLGMSESSSTQTPLSTQKSSTATLLDTGSKLGPLSSNESKQTTAGQIVDAETYLSPAPIRFLVSSSTQTPLETQTKLCPSASKDTPLGKQTPLLRLWTQKLTRGSLL